MWLRRGWRWRRTRRGRNAWRMDQAPVSQVAWAHVPELTPRAAPADVVPPPSPWPAAERVDQEMPSVYCARCGRASPEGARFCSHCGAPLVRGGGERPGESTSTISLGGTDLADAEYEEPLAETTATEALPAGTALLLVKRPERGQPVPPGQRAHHGGPPPGQRHLPRRRHRVPAARGVLPARGRVHRARRRQPERHLREP